MNRKYLLTLAVLPIAVTGVAFARVRTHTLELKAANSNLTTYDYSKTNNTGIVSGGNVLQAVKEGQTLDAAEVAYANSHFQVKYDKFPADKTKFHYGIVDGKIYVEGFKFDGFEADHVEYTLNGVAQTTPFDNQSTRYQIIATIPEEAENVNVVYKHTFDLDVSAANEVLNAAYNVGQHEVEIQQAHDAYVQKLNAYNNYNAELEKFKSYETAHNAWIVKNENYQNYLTQKAQYDAKLAEYNTYVNELNSYETKLESYKAYQNGLDAYNANKTAIEAALAEYNKKMLQVDYQLEVMELFYLGPTAFPSVEAGGTLYSYIYRDAVNQVLNRQSDLSALGVPEIAISKAGEATVTLRNLLDSYKTLRDAKDKEGMYKFYIKNYSRIKSNTITLAQCLEKFFLNGAVRTVMEQQGKTQRYIYLIAELIYVAERLSDTPVNCFDKVYGGSLNYALDHTRVIEGKTVQQILGLSSIPEKPYTTKPLSAYPVSVEEVYGKKPEPADFGLANDQPPARPEAKEQPVAPQVVAAPGNEPIPQDFGLVSAVRPVKVDNPGTEPEQRNNEFNSLYELVKSNDLEKQTEHDSPVELTVYESFGLRTTQGVSEQNIALYVYATGSGDVKIHEVVFVSEGESPRYTHDPALEQGSAENLYKWIQDWKVKGQDEAFSFDDLFTGSATIEGVFGAEQTIEKFEVEWLDEEGNNILGNGVTTEAYNVFRPVFYSDSVSKDEETPFKQATSTARYDFAGISYEDASGTIQNVSDVTKLPAVKNPNEAFKIVNGKISITVKFDVVELISVKFVDGQKVLFDAGTVEENTRVNYGGATPAREETATARYEFTGWAVNGVKIQTFPYKVTKPASGNEIVIEAQFKEIKKWNITFEYGDGASTSQVLENGVKPVAPTNLDKQFTDNKYYVFNGWNNKVVAATENATYTAQYLEKNIIENATITRNNGLTIAVNNGVDTINVSKFVELLGEGYQSSATTIEFSKGVIELTEANVKQLEALKVAQIKLVNNVLSDGRREVEVVMLDKNGAPITGQISFKVLIRSIQDLAHTKVVDSNGSVTFEPVGTNNMKIEMVSNNKVTIGTYYKITFDEYSNCKYKVNGEVKSLSSSVELLKGQQVNVEAVANNGIKVTSVIVLNPDYTTIVEETGTEASFILNGDVKIYSNSELKVHTIRVIVDGEVDFEITASYGSKIALPTPYKRPENGTTYSFEGWENVTGNLNSITVTGDMDLVAVFSETKDIENNGLAQARSYTKLAGEILLIVSLVGFTAGFIIILVKKPKESD